MRNVSFRRRTRRFVQRIVDNRLVYFSLKQGPESVLLTFDDGPHVEYTPRVLDKLDERETKAVFFLIGSEAAKYPDLVQEIHRRGHVLGNHTYSHLNDYRNGRYSVSQYLGEIRRCQESLYSIAGVETKLFRPPRGELNYKTLTATFWARHRMVHWSLEGGEWGRRSRLSGEEIADFVRDNLKPRDIVLLHDDNPKTLQILEELILLAEERDMDLRSAALTESIQ